MRFEPKALNEPAFRSPPIPDPKHVLFLCTGNSARSILAEAILNRESKGRFTARSAGSHSMGELHPMTLDLLRREGHDTAFARSKSRDEFAAPGAPDLHFVFTVRDNAAGGVCPFWPGRPMTAHWGVPDPAAAEGSDAERALAFANLPVATLDAMTLQAKPDRIGETGGAE